MISYLEQLQTKAGRAGIFLYQAFAKAGINQTTYARTRKARTSLRLKTAVKVSTAIDLIVFERGRKKALHPSMLSKADLAVISKAKVPRLRVVPKKS